MSPSRRNADVTDAASLVDLLVAMRRYTERTYSPAGGHDDADGRARPHGHAAIAGDGGEPRFTVRETERGILVAADLQGVVRNTHRTEIDLGEDALVLTVGQRYACRVPVEGHQSSIADVSVNNDVLEARVEIME